ncbi:uncharacterized protein TNIN_355411 [Trichonephila inaurata madagascariensis]|uniref:Uncharacterized protein n=1 Tax=Trichonephila inaurata madagascariensis TaxID=2747483 RepID=A0A8X6I719_9ARAC|nr:uncharacterized protein TNIN_355411 [Trichonephila inaurata madagascariensis]
MLFAEDLVDFVLKQYEITWTENDTGIRRFRNRLKKHFFKPEIGKAVCDLISENEVAITSSYYKLIEKGVDCIDDFRYEASITTIFHLKYGYNRLKYLELCALFCGVAGLFFQRGDETFARTVASASSQLLAYIINFSIYDKNVFRDEAWFDLLITARMISRRIKNGLSYKEDDNDDIILPYFDNYF